MSVIEIPGLLKFALIGDRGAGPQPLVVALSSSVGSGEHQPEQTKDKIYSMMVERGYLMAGLGIPRHAEYLPPGEPEGLPGWRAYLEDGHDFVASFVPEVSKVVDYLVAQGKADPERITAFGVSRTAFLAFHFAAADDRVKRVIGWAPVTDLRLLTEFADMQDNALAEALALSNGAANLVNKRIWISIGNDDQRVSTEAAISFSRAVVRACAAAKVPANVELHMYAQPGHSVPLRAHKDAAQWFFADTGDCPGFPVRCTSRQAPQNRDCTLR